ncbi:MAG: flagellar biosynthetic protein FliO [Candidatus Baltobacteraceae bacterium]
MLALYARYLFALIVVALMLGGLYVIVRALGRGRLVTSADKRLVTVIESTFLAQNTTLHVIKAGARYYLLGGGNGRASTLAELAPEEVEPWLAGQRALFTQQAKTIGGFIEQFRRKNT